MLNFARERTNSFGRTQLCADMLMAVAAIGVCSADFDDNKPASRRSNILMTMKLRKIETLSDDDRKFSIAMQR